MTLLSLYNAIVANITPGGGADRITSAELRSVLEMIRGELLNRGVLQVANTATLATTANTEAKIVFVPGIGHFFDSAPGTLVHNGKTIFTGQGGRFWVLLQHEPLRYELEDDLTPIAIPPGVVVTMIIITPADESTIKAGTVAGGNDIFPEDLIDAGADFVSSTVIVARTEKLIYFTGITSATKILVYTNSI